TEITAEISLSSRVVSADSAAAWSMTISISCAPLLIASVASAAFVCGVWAPVGNPITVQTFTSVWAKRAAARVTQIGWMHTEAVRNCAAWSQSLSISEAVVVGDKRV